MHLLFLVREVSLWLIGFSAMEHLIICLTGNDNVGLDFVEDKSKLETIILSDGRKHYVEGSGNVAIKISSGETIIFHDAPKSTTLGCDICFIEDKRNGKVTTSEIKEHGQ